MSCRSQLSRSVIRRRAAAVLVAASSGLAMLGAADSAYGTTFTFSTAGGDWLDPTSWSPNGIPGAGDVALIRTNTAVDPTLNAGTMTIGAIVDDTSTARILSNPNLTTGSQITLTGISGQPLILMTRSTSSGTSFAIPGYNGTNTGSFNLVLGASGDIRTVVNAPLVLGANIGETGGSQSIRKVGFGTLALAGSNSFTGSTEVERGNLLLDFTSNTGNKLSSTGSLIMSGGSLFMNGNATQAVSQTVNGLYINSAQNTIGIDVSGTGQNNATLSLGDLHRSVGAYVNINYTPNGTSGGLPAATTSTPNGTYGILGGWITVGNNDWAINSSGNILPYSGYTTKNDVSTWSTGDNITNSAAFSSSVPNDLTIGSLRYNASGTTTATISAGKTLTIGSGGILVTSSSGNGTLAGGNLTSGVDELIFTTASGKVLTVSSVIANNSATPLTITKVGSGTLTLTGANTYSGDVYVNTGTIQANTIAATGTPSSLGTSGVIHLGSPDTVLTPARLVYTGATTSTDRGFVFGEGGAAFNVTNQNATLTLTGSITGNGSISVNNAVVSGVSAVLAIQGTKGFSGMTFINTGILSVDTLAPIGQPSGLGTGLDGGTVAIGNGTAGTFQYSGSTASTDRPLQLGNGTDGGSINLVATDPNATLTWGGPMYFASGQPLNPVPGSTSITFNTGPANVRPFSLRTAGTLIYNGSIGTGSAIFGQLRKDGTGTVILGGNNGYAIGTTVNSGTLITNSNFSNGTITNVSTTNVIGLNVSGATAFAQVAQKTTNNATNGTTAVPSLAVGATANLDLTNNALVVYNTTSPLSQIKGLLTTGYHGGLWDGAGGIISSTAAASGAGHKTALGYALASDLNLAGGTFYGQNVPDGTDVVVAYVLEGDANLDGVVNALDFNALATNFGAASPGWAQADFNYDGTVNALDFVKLATNFNLATPTPAPSLGTLVPEPASIGLIGLLGGLVGLRRRVRRRIFSDQ